MTPALARPQRVVRVGGLRARAGKGWRHESTALRFEWRDVQREMLVKK